MREQDGFSNCSEFKFMIGKRGGEMGLPLGATFGYIFGWRMAR